MVCKSLKECFAVDLHSREPGTPRGVMFCLESCLKNSGYLAVVLFRISQYLWTKPVVWRGAFYIKRFNEIVTGFECHLEASIGRGLFLPHTQNLVVGAGVVAGENLTLYNGVTLGALKTGERGGGTRRYPFIGDNVTIYTGAKIIGPVTIGNGAVIGANSVVIKDVLEGSIAVGIPARTLARREHV